MVIKGKNKKNSNNNEDKNGEDDDNDKNIERLEDDIEDLEKADENLRRALNKQTKETISLKEEVKHLRLEHKKHSEFWNKLIAISSIIGSVASVLSLGLAYYYRPVR